MGTELGSTDTIKSKGPVKVTSMVTESRPSNHAAPQDQEALTIRAVKNKIGSVIMVTCPTCGTEAVAESARPDIQKLSGRYSSRRYLRYKRDGANRTLAKLRQAELDLEEKFAQADQIARDLALAKAETLEKLAKAKCFKVEAEKSKVAAIHYQDSMEVDSDNKIVLSQSAVGVLSTPGQPGTHVKISTEESKAIRKSHMVGGSRTAPLDKQKPVPYAFPTPPPTINGHLLTDFFNEMRQGMVGMWGNVRGNYGPQI
jgi:hypothetical protein